MTLAEIFEINDPICIEPAIMDCADSEYTRFLLDGDYSAAKLLVDENEDPIAAAFLEEGGWTVTSFVFRPFSFEVLERVEALDGDIYQEERSNYLAALREYYCNEILKEFPDVIEDNREGRYEMIEGLFDSLNLIPETDGNGAGDSTAKPTAIDFCCGSGVATSVLRDLGYETLSFDYDAALISCGIQRKRLEPSRAMCLDGTRASDFCPKCNLGIGLMLGDITNFNADMWEDIIYELFELSEKTVISTATKPEIERVAGWCSDAGRRYRIIGNDRDPIYDAWVCVSEE
ncbi:MAG: hypothetical protein II893_00385 [Methanomicrobium sp.]|nr:hypothetical protein [Methanomicrobium sp.]